MITPGVAMTPAQAETLASQVDGVFTGLQGLAALLVREREALMGRASPQVLDAVAIDKQEAVAGVAGSYDLLRATVERLTGNGDDLAASFAAIKSQHPQLTARVEALVALTRECHLVNQENGILVNARLNGTRGALDALENAGAGPAMPATYGRVGTRSGAVAGERFTASA